MKKADFSSELAAAENSGEVIYPWVSSFFF